MNYIMNELDYESEDSETSTFLSYRVDEDYYYDEYPHATYMESQAYNYSRYHHGKYYHGSSYQYSYR